MRKLVLFTVLSLAGLSVAAQQQPSPAAQQQKPAPAAQKGGSGESAYEWRIRAEGAAGGTAPPPERERKGVGAGAKPHMHFDQLDRGLHRRSESELIWPGE